MDSQLTLSKEEQRKLYKQVCRELIKEETDAEQNLELAKINDYIQYKSKLVFKDYLQTQDHHCWPAFEFQYGIEPDITQNPEFISRLNELNEKLRILLQPARDFFRVNTPIMEVRSPPNIKNKKLKLQFKHVLTI